jgi:hypothetical protein
MPPFYFAIPNPVKPGPGFAGTRAFSYDEYELRAHAELDHLIGKTPRRQEGQENSFY